MHEIQMLGLLEQDVLSSIEVPYLPEKSDDLVDLTESPNFTNREADRFDLDTFSLSPGHNASILGGLPSLRHSVEKRGSQRHSVIARIDPIEESPKLPVHEHLPPEPRVQTKSVNPPSEKIRSASPSQSSVRSQRSEKSVSSKISGSTATSKGLAAKLAPSWLFNPFRSNPSEPQMTNVSASASPTSRTIDMRDQFSEKAGPLQKEQLSGKPTKHVSYATSAPIQTPPSNLTTTTTSTQQIQPMAIRNKIPNRPGWNRSLEDDSLHKGATSRHSPVNTPPSDGFISGKRRSTTSLAYSYPSSTSPGSLVNPTRPRASTSYSQFSLASRWQHVFPRPLYKHEIKWKPIVTPGCLPLTVEHFPSSAILESSYDVFSYEFIIDPGEMRSFLVKPPHVKGSADDLRRAWALVVMRGMAAVRLAQGFQFVLRRQKHRSEEDKQPGGASAFRRTKSFAGEEELDARPAGAAEVLTTTADPVYLSMTNEIHRISYTGEAIQVKRYVRRLAPSPPAHYKCLIWPKLGGELCTFCWVWSAIHAPAAQVDTQNIRLSLNRVGWRITGGIGKFIGWDFRKASIDDGGPRLDMLVAGYEHHFNESLRYWRTRFVVIPTLDPPHIKETGNDRLSEEEARINGIEKLAEMFTKIRWQPPDEKTTYPPVRFLNTTLDPALCVLDEGLMDQMDTIHSQGPLKKKMKSDREIGDLSLNAIAKAMREEDGVPIKFHQWHKSQYPDSFIGYDFVSWLVREFRDMSTRAQATDFGNKLQEQGLFEHCRGKHSFLDG